jgi:hypothetical protein
VDATKKAVTQARGIMVGDGQLKWRGSGHLSGACLSVSIDMHPPLTAILAAPKLPA